MGENDKERFARARAELKEDLELYRLLMAYQEETSGLDDLDGLAKMALAALADSEAEYLKAGAAAGYAEPERPVLPPPEPQRAEDLMMPIAPEGLSRLIRPQPPPEPGSMSTEDLMRLVEEDADLHNKP
ncbi:MAG: hypothetical protein ACYC8T_06520 [Myxococcaceae bacterium]